MSVFTAFFVGMLAGAVVGVVFFAVILASGNAADEEGEIAEEQREIAKCYVSTEYPRVRTQRRKCNKCAREHAQLAEWLKELKTLREVHGKVYRNEKCDRAGKCIDYIGYHCAGCNSAKEGGAK